jgi:hypothetical protein
MKQFLLLLLNSRFWTLDELVLAMHKKRILAAPRFGVSSPVAASPLKKACGEQNRSDPT